MLYETPSLSPDDFRVIEEIEAFRAEFRHRLAEPHRWEGQLRRSLTAAAVRGSTHIEGYSITAQDAETLVAGGEISPETDDATRGAVTGYRDALTYIQRASGFRIFSWDHTLLSALHFMMTRTDEETRPGEYRTGAAWVSGGPNRPPVYTAPDPEQVPDLMAELLTRLDHDESDVPALVRASMAHLNLVSIHPWRDGNGRMSRAVHTLVLAREGVLAPEFSSIEEWLGADDFNTREYYAALRSVQHGSWQPRHDAHSWIRFCLTAHHLQAQEVQRRFETAARLWFRLEAIARRHGLDERTVSALYAATNGTLRRTTYQAEEALTRDQALGDLRALRRLNLVESVGHARTQHYLAGAEVRRARIEIHNEVHADLYREPYPD
ncbi:Fic family protein [Embleya sp. NPDC008237]|uniref:Fic family protein n=1 Tax=Embleya sp. NPDC008237 TaxID=3363978 RepID=UPI0036F0E481